MKKENIISRGITYLPMEVNSAAYGDVKTLGGSRYVVIPCLGRGFVDIFARGCVFKISALCKGEDNILKIQRAKDIFDMSSGLGDKIITSDYFQSSLHPTKGEVEILSTLYHEIVELIMDFGGLYEEI